VAEFRVAAPTVWNSLPLHLHNATISERQFKSALTTHLFNLAFKLYSSTENFEEWTYYLLFYLSCNCLWIIGLVNNLFNFLCIINHLHFTLLFVYNIDRLVNYHIILGFLPSHQIWKHVSGAGRKSVEWERSGERAELSARRPLRSKPRRDVKSVIDLFSFSVNYHYMWLLLSWLLYCTVYPVVCVS